jgi:hypothetical protein
MQLGELVETEERRARSGAPLTAARVLEHDAALAAGQGLTPLHDPEGVSPWGGPFDLAALNDALRPGGHPRPALLRAIAASVACGSGVLAELTPALLLCAAGLTDRLRFLPFEGVGEEGRAAALLAWREGDLDPCTALLLGACAQGARQRRLALTRELNALRNDEAHLAPLGRAAITARRALEVLRESLATSMPQLSVRLDCSRPAAGDALERLVEIGLAVEITGRQRDRVFACARTIAMLV